jgi:hypothetical protein
MPGSQNSDPFQDSGQIQQLEPDAPGHEGTFEDGTKRTNIPAETTSSTCVNRVEGMSQDFCSSSQLIHAGLTLPDCPAKFSIYLAKWNWRSISTIALSLYSAAFSGIRLLIAIVRPRYGRIIHPGGSFAQSTASTHFALFAKAIEIASATIFVTFLGQNLSRSSLASRDFSIAYMAMRVWVIQPGYVLSHWQNVKYVGITILGVSSLLASLTALLFTTASSTLVAPHLIYGNWENSEIYGKVQGTFATLNS